MGVGRTRLGCWRSVDMLAPMLLKFKCSDAVFKMYFFLLGLTAVFFCSDLHTHSFTAAPHHGFINVNRVIGVSQFHVHNLFNVGCSKFFSSHPWTVKFLDSSILGLTKHFQSFIENSGLSCFYREHHNDIFLSLDYRLVCVALTVWLIKTISFHLKHIG